MRIFVNCIPKAGTHLIRQIMRPVAEPDSNSPVGIVSWLDHGWSAIQRQAEDVAEELQRVDPGSLAYGHLSHYHAKFAGLDEDWILIFLVRDLRDVAISMKHHIMNSTLTFPESVRQYYQTIPRNERDVLDYTIQFVGTRWPFFDGWLHDERVIRIRYEDLRERTMSTLQDLTEQLEARGWQNAVGLEDAMEASIYPEGSPTFRVGQAGSYEQEFDNEARSSATRWLRTGNIQMGYEEGVIFR